MTQHEDEGVLSIALTMFLTSEEYKKIKEQELVNHKKFVDKFLKKCKPATDQPSHTPEKEIEKK